MNINKEFELLSDLAKLMKKYGPDTFEDLANELSKPLFVERFVDVLKSTTKISRTIPKSRKVRRNPTRTDFRASLVNGGGSENEKSALLIELYDGLRSRAILPTLRDLQNFIVDNGLPPIKSTSREKALVPFVKTFLPMPIESVRDYLNRIQPPPSDDDESLEGWSNIIFNRSKRYK